MSQFESIVATVLGTGSIGRRHIKNLQDLGVKDIVGVDPDSGRLQPVVDELGVRGATNFEDANQGREVDVVLVCSPPSLHAEQCLQAAICGINVFVEKPFANNLADIDKVAEMAYEHGGLVQVGYNLRFIPALQTLKKLIDEGSLGRPLWSRFEAGHYLPDWRPWQDYRQSYTARKELGGGIVMDGSHEIDLALWLLGKPTEVCCMAGHLSDLEMDVEDSATLLLRFESGAQADVHMDCIQREYSRGLKIAFEKGTAAWSWPQNLLRIFEVDKGQRVIEPPEGYGPNQMYIDEIKHFLSKASAYDRNAARRGCEEGREVVRVALAALQSSAERKWVTL